MRKIQIGVIGSAADLCPTLKAHEIAEKVGESIAESGAVLVFGAESDRDSLSTVASRAAKAAGGLTIGIAHGNEKEVWEKNGIDIIIVTGLERGGAREAALVMSCDAILSIGGGSGTLTEISMAYQADIPVIALHGTGGWSDKLAGSFLDDRKRRRILAADSPEEAVELAIRQAEEIRR